MSETSQIAKPTVHLDKIGQIAITVSDLARSKNFYQNTLGMKFLFDAGNMAFFQCSDIRFMIGTSPEPVSASGTILYFKVLDIHVAHSHLVAQGVAFTHAPQLVAKMPDHELWMAFLSDPDGNQLALMSEVPRPA